LTFLEMANVFIATIVSSVIIILTVQVTKSKKRQV
jgi:hypothetical protein